MVQKPADFIPDLPAKITRIILHLESESFYRDLLEDIRDKGFVIGLALNPETPIEDLEPFLDFAEIIQFMTVHPGLQGQAFLPEVLAKIKEFCLKFPDFPVQVDGGINPTTAKLATEAGANLLVSGSYLLECDDLKKCILSLEEATRDDY